MVASAVVLGLVCVLSVVLRSELRRSKVPPSAASAVVLGLVGVAVDEGG